MNVNQHLKTPASVCSSHQSSLSQPTEYTRKTTGAHRPDVGQGKKRLLTTGELALGLGMSAQSIRKRYSQTGSYFQLQPIKLPNRRLLWPADSVEHLINGGA